MMMTTTEQQPRTKIILDGNKSELEFDMLLPTFSDENDDEDNEVYRFNKNSNNNRSKSFLADEILLQTMIDSANKKNQDHNDDDDMMRLIHTSLAPSNFKEQQNNNNETFLNSYEKSFNKTSNLKPTGVMFSSSMTDEDNEIEEDCSDEDGELVYFNENIIFNRQFFDSSLVDYQETSNHIDFLFNQNKSISLSPNFNEDDKDSLVETSISDEDYLSDIHERNVLPSLDNSCSQKKSELMSARKRVLMNTLENFQYDLHYPSSDDKICKEIFHDMKILPSFKNYFLSSLLFDLTTKNFLDKYPKFGENLESFNKFHDQSMAEKPWSHKLINNKVQDQHKCFITPSISMSNLSSVATSKMGKTQIDPLPYSSTLASIRDAVSHITRLDDFNVVKLSQGFFSQVFKVTHLPTSKIMVLKMNKNPSNRSNALREIELLNKLNHPNIVSYMGTVVHEGALHPLLEYINGGTLEQLIQQFYCKNDKLMSMGSASLEKNLTKQMTPKIHSLKNPDRTFVKLMLDVCGGMAYLHSKKYLHRDLASKNVFIRKHINCDKNGNRLNEKIYDFKLKVENEKMGEKVFDDHCLQAVIGDFGFAIAEPTSSQQLNVVGSPYWLAPECLSYKWYNHKCDIFSFGVICCELNWYTPSDPDYLPRCDNYDIDFAKISNKKNTFLGRVAQLACQHDPNMRPEFEMLFKMFQDGLEIDEDDDDDTENNRMLLRSCCSLMSSACYRNTNNEHHLKHSSSDSQLFPTNFGIPFDSFSVLSKNHCCHHNISKENSKHDIFEQHLRRRFTALRRNFKSKKL